MKSLLGFVGAVWVLSSCGSVDSTPDAGGRAGGAAGGSVASGGGSAGGGAGGAGGGSAAAVSFSTDVAPILTAQCGSCHSLRNAVAANTFVRSTSARAPCSSTGRKLIVASNGTGSLLYEKISGTQSCGSRMPLGCSGNDCLPQAKIDLIKRWIDEGANDN